MPIAGKPLLFYWFYLCQQHGIREVLINLHYLAELVEDYVRGLDHENIEVNVVREERLLGSGGTIADNAGFINGEGDFYILYTDNLTNVNLTSLLEFHRSHDGLVTMGLFRTTCPEQCGVVQLDANGLITSFQEKPERPPSDLANAGVLVASPQLLGYIPPGDQVDLGHQVLPKLEGRMYGYMINEYIQDIGTVEKYLDALRQWRGFGDSRAEYGIQSVHEDLRR
jgi:mannose-1-phosphate guanylyltransferase